MADRILGALVVVVTLAGIASLVGATWAGWHREYAKAAYLMACAIFFHLVVNSGDRR